MSVVEPSATPLEDALRQHPAAERLEPPRGARDGGGAKRLAVAGGL